MTLGRYLLFGIIIATVFVWISYLFFGVNNDDYLYKENRELKNQVKQLNKRVGDALQILEDIRNRDDNFYRVMLQMDPMNINQRYAGLAKPSLYNKYSQLSNSDFIIQLNKDIDLLNRQLYAQSLSFDELRSVAMKQHDKINHIPAVLPINIDDYTMSSGYGYRVDPVYGGTKFHAGLDFATPMGTPVYATAEGVVKEAGIAGGYGNRIDIDHGYNYLTRFGHLSKIDVTVGQKVKRGDKIGEVGSTGKSTGPHLHYEVRFKGEPQNPVNYYFLDITPDEYQSMITAAANAGNVMD
jgi:murein DD-endopeptidase MepM/ murein hydrolase activator NlpD